MRREVVYAVGVNWTLYQKNIETHIWRALTMSSSTHSFAVILTRIRPIAYMLNYMKKSMSMLIFG